MNFITSTLLFLIVATTAATKLHYVYNTHDNMYLCLSSDGSIVLTHTPTSTSCPTIQFNVQPHNDGLVFTFKHKNVCRYMCMDACGVLYNEDKYEPTDCTWTTVAFKSLDTLSQKRGNTSYFLASHSYYIHEFSVGENFILENFSRNVNFTLLLVNSPSKSNVCSLSTKTIGKPRDCTSPYIRSHEKIDTHQNYSSINLLDKLLEFLGLYKLTPETPDNSLRNIDFTANYK